MFHNTLCRLAIAVCMLTPCAGFANPAERAAQIAPYLDDQTFAVAYLDSSRIDTAVVLEQIAELAPNLRIRKQIAGSRKMVEGPLKALKDTKTELFVVMSLADLPVPGPFVIALPQASSDQQKVIDALSGLQLPVCKAINGTAVYCGTQEVFERLQSTQPAARPGFSCALVAGDDAPAQLLVALSADQRRVVAEMLPRLPEALGGGSGRALADIEWAVGRVQFTPAIGFHLIAQSPTDESALALKSTLSSLLFALGRNEEVRKRVPTVDELLLSIVPTASGRQVQVSINSAAGNLSKLLTVLAAPAGQLQASAQRARCTNNLKQLALGMHIYHDKHKEFPGAASVDADGKPLLSWRVHLLPHLEQAELYKQFHLDEPWNSEHNKALISQMPPVFACPSADFSDDGKTTYLVPTGPNAVFKQGKGTRIRDITDGTSNTVMIVDASPDHAVIWTKPDDLVVDPKQPTSGLGGAHDNAFPAAYCDGSVRWIPSDIAKETLRRILDPKDGNPIPAF